MPSPTLIATYRGAHHSRPLTAKPPMQSTVRCYSPRCLNRVWVSSEVEAVLVQAGRGCVVIRSRPRGGGRSSWAVPDWNTRTLRLDSFRCLTYTPTTTLSSNSLQWTSLCELPSI